MAKGKGIRSDTTWSGFVLIVVVAMLVGVYFLRMGQGTDLVDAKIDPNLVVLQVKKAPSSSEIIVLYENQDYSFKVGYPQGWQFSTSSTGEGEAEIFSIQLGDDVTGVSISVMSEDMESLVRNSISINSERQVVISGATAQRLEGSSLKDGSSVSMLIVKSNGQLYIISGAGQNFDKIVDYFELL